MKVHLDSHFAENNEIRKRKKIGPCMYPNQAVATAVGSIISGSSNNAGGINSTIGAGSENRPLFQSFNGWIQQGKGVKGCLTESSQANNRKDKADDPGVASMEN